MIVPKRLTQLLAHTDIISTPFSLHGFLCCSLSQPISPPESNEEKSYVVIKKLSQYISDKEMETLKAFAKPIKQQLDNDDLTLVLPDELSEEATMQHTMQVIDEWIDGFNFAYAHFQKTNSQQTDVDIHEWLKDLAKIQRCCQQHTAKHDDVEKPATEENALDLIEITEFIRAGVYLCKTTWQQKLS